MFVTIKDNRQVEVRLLDTHDEPNLFHYFEGLSAETKSRYGPHPFDRSTVHEICLNPADGMKRFIAIDPASTAIIAYMLIKEGMITGDLQRFADRGMMFEQSTACTFAPSIADNWQSAGLGTAMYKLIEDELKNWGKKTIVLWGGVQASNSKAFQYYSKLGFVKMGSFINNNIDNYDMVKEI